MGLNQCHQYDASASPPGAYCKSSYYCNVTGDHASFPEKYTVSAGWSVKFAENVMITYSTLDDLYELGGRVIPDTRPFYGSFCHGSRFNQLPPCFWAIHSREEE